MKKKAVSLVLTFCIVLSSFFTGNYVIASGKEPVLKDLPTSWDLTKLFADEEAFESEVKKAEDLIPKLEDYRGTLNSVEGILAYLEDPDLIELYNITRTVVMYSAFLLSLDSNDQWAQKVNARKTALQSKYQIAQSFFEAELMEMPLEKRQEIVSDERLSPYAYYLEYFADPDNIKLSEESMKIRTLLINSFNNNYTRDILDYVELPRPEFEYPDGSKGILDDTTYSNILESKDYDHEFRKEIYELRNKMRQPYANTYASLLEGQMRLYWANAQIYGFDSTLEWKNNEDDVDNEVYDKVIQFSHDMLPNVQKYYKAKKDLSGQDEFMICDLNQPVTDYQPRNLTYEEAMNLGREGISAWGDEYLEIFDKIVTSPNIDVYPSENKETGAYEFLTSNTVLPYVLYNYTGLESYVDTLVHEMGHAVYSEFSSENQNVYNNYPVIFTQEVASISNELMFYKYMVENAASKDEKIYWLNKEIYLFTSSLSRQCNYSEFEDYCYKTIEAGGGLSADAMAEKWLELSKLYYGDEFTIPEYSGIDWARIPHYYSCYYVYNYATSITYAASINQRIEEEGQAARDDYIAFLKAGNSQDPVSLLKIAGVDPLDDSTYEAAGKYLENLIDEFIEMVTEESASDKDRETIYQVSLLQGLTLGDYNGSVSAAELKEKGDIGIGTFEGLNGEMITLDGAVYRADGEGKVEEVSDDEGIPFSNVTFFDEDEKISLSKIDSIETLQEELDKKVKELGKNRFYFVRIDGLFSEINVRSEYAQEKPYKPLAKVLETDQTFFDYEDIEGTVVALYCPGYMSNMNATGWHMHFISDDRERGGHVLGLKLENAEAAFDITDKFELKLPDNEMFSAFDLTIDQSEDIEKVEKKTE